MPLGWIRWHIRSIRTRSGLRGSRRAFAFLWRFACWWTLRMVWGLIWDPCWLVRFSRCLHRESKEGREYPHATLNRPWSPSLYHGRSLSCGLFSGWWLLFSFCLGSLGFLVVLGCRGLIFDPHGENSLSVRSVRNLKISDRFSTCWMLSTGPLYCSRCLARP